MIRIAFLLPHVLGFLKRRRLSCPGFHHTFVVANFFFVGVKAVWVVLSLPDNQVSVLWWLLLLLSAVSIVAQRGCLHHLRSSMPRPRYKTIFIGSRLDARLLGDQYDSGTGSEDDDDDYEDEYSSAEESGRSDVESSGLGTRSGGGNRGGGGGSEEAKGSLGRVMGAGRNRTPKSKGERQRSLSRSAIPGGGKRRGRKRRRRKRSRSRSSRQESTRELVDFFAHRMQEARDAWSGRVSALQKRWQASFLSGDAWGMRGGGSPAADRDAALRLTFGLIVRMYAYENTLEDLRLAAEEDPVCLEAFAPQFASFLVWDSYYMSGQVEAWLLDRCSENLYFAHALEFQLRAGRNGGRRCYLFDVAGPPGRTLARRAVELLLKDIAENGERAARRLVAGEAGRIGGGVGAGAGGGGAEGVDDGGNGSYGSMRTTAMAAVAGGDTGTTAAPFLYRQTIDFLASLADIASSLTPLSKSERTPLLKEKLSEVGKDASAGNSIERLVYVPVGNRHHRIVAVHPSESFAFSTRERAPCFVCLEVVGAKEPPAGRRKGRRRRGRGQRMQALRQWLPRGVSFQQNRKGTTIEGCRARAGPAVLPPRRPRTSRKGAGTLSAARAGSLLMEEGGEGSDGASGVVPLSSMSDAREWWTESSTGTGKPWGGEDDVGDDDLADVPERRLRLSKASPPGGDSSAAFSRRMDAAATTMDSGGEAPVLFNELWHDKSNRIRRVSPWADEPGWRLLPVIVKSNDDLRQEQLASQLLFVMQRILRAEGVRAWLRPYDIVALSADTGIIEAVPDTISLDALRRYRAGADGGEGAADPAASRFSLTGFFEARFGAKGSEGFRQAQRRFIESLAAYSIACYLLQIKDRHNGNILLDSQGRVIHIDFGFILANSPGGNLGFESAPFKLTQGFLNLMGGTQSRCFREFRGLCVDTFLALRRSSQEIVLLVEMMASGNESLPCFQGPGGGAAAAADLAARFQPELNDPACQDFVHKLVQQSAGSWTTAWYDKYQRFWSGIY
ncbi:unnamed protein product [Scytosiphon promiscuus]